MPTNHHTKSNTPQQSPQLEKITALAGSIAHEMRNPLNLCAMTADILTGSIDDITHSLQEMRNMLNTMKTGIIQGDQLINIILNNIKNKPIDNEDFVALSAHFCVQKALNTYSFKPEEIPMIHYNNLGNDFIFQGDETLICHVMYNLLKNALYELKNNYEGRIDISLSNKDNNNFILFEDNGPGIAQDKIKGLFADFTSNDKKEGTGLGLSFCHRVMKSFGGDISVESKQGDFTRFILRFPS